MNNLTVTQNVGLQSRLSLFQTGPGPGPGPEHSIPDLSPHLLFTQSVSQLKVFHKNKSKHEGTVSDAFTDLQEN